MVNKPTYEEIERRLRELERTGSEYRKAIKESRLNEERFLRLYEYAPLGYQSLDSEGRFIEVNRTWCDLMGFSRSEVIERWFGEFLAPREIEPYKQSFQEFISTGEMHIDVQMLRRDGSEITIHIDGCIGHNERGHFKQTHCILYENMATKRAEKDIIENKERFHAIFERIPSGAVVCEALDDGKDFIIKEFNRSAENIEKIDGERVIGRRVTEVFTGAKEFGIIVVIKRVWKTCEAEYFSESVYKDEHDPGSWREYWVSKLPSGEIVAVYNDVTERKQDQEALQKSESIFRLFTETIKDVFWMSTVGVGKMIYISPAYENIWERSTKSLYQSPRSFMEAIHPEDIDGCIEIMNKYHKNGKKYECYYRIIRMDEEVRWIHERGFPIEDLFYGEQVMVGVCKDITDKKLMEMALQKSQEQYRMVVEDQTEIISRFKPDGTLTFINETYCRFFGKSSSDLIGKKWSPVAYEDDLPIIYRQLQKMSAENPVVVVENRVWDAAGRKRWMQFVNRGFFDEKGRLSELQSVGRDITIIKDKEQLLYISQKEIQEQAKDLKKVNTAMEVLLERRNRQIEELEANIYRNFSKLILPDLNNLKDRLKNGSNKKSVSLIIQNIVNLLSSGSGRLTCERYGLTKTELKIASMILCDMTSAEIVEHLSISCNTVGFHRKNLRKKLNIRKSKIDLSNYLKHHL